MSVKDLHNNIEQKVLLAQTEITSNTDTLSAIIDTTAYMGHEFIVIASEISDGVYDIAINEGDVVDDVAAPTTITDAAEAASDDLLVTAANLQLVVADSGKSVRVGYIGTKRWLQVKLTSTAVTGGAFFNVLSVQGIAKFARTPDAKA